MISPVIPDLGVTAAQHDPANPAAMPKEIDPELTDELRPGYDVAQMAGGVRGKYSDRDRAGTNLARLDPDVARAFPTDAAVNEALRLLMQVAQRQPFQTTTPQIEKQP